MTLIKSIYKRAQAKLKSVSFENINEKQVEAQNAFCLNLTKNMAWQWQKAEANNIYCPLNIKAHYILAKIQFIFWLNIVQIIFLNVFSNLFQAEKHYYFIHCILFWYCHYAIMGSFKIVVPKKDTKILFFLY